MKVKDRRDSDGICFARRFEECLVLKKMQRGCNTYQCLFYKPCGCEDWIRREVGSQILMTPPEEYRR